MIIQDLLSRGLIQPPKWLPDNCAYITIMGSQAYGVSSNNSDEDLYGFCFPPKDVVWPHLAGEIPGFGKQIQRFDQWQQHHIKRPDNGKEYDFSIYSIVKYFQLCMDNNPNMIDSLFTPVMCIKHITSVGQLVKDNRKLFLHKGSWHKFKGYAFSQLHKIEIKNTDPTSKRYAMVQEHGFDLKYSYHLLRLIGEVEQILEEGDLDLTRNNEQLKAVRRGDWSLVQIKEYFERKLSDLETLYRTSTLQHSPDESQIKALLLHCLETHYGSLANAVVKQTSVDQLVKDIDNLLGRYRK